MKVKGILRGRTIELIEAIDLPNETEIVIDIDEQQFIMPEKRRRRLNEFLNRPRTPEEQQAFDELAANLENMDAKQQEMMELYYGSRDEYSVRNDRPLSSFIGSAKGSFATPEEVDQFIRQERDSWES
jgi:antitoxin component of MazEF toxin-antitoxin module